MSQDFKKGWVCSCFITDTRDFELMLLILSVDGERRAVFDCIFLRIHSNLWGLCFCSLFVFVLSMGWNLNSRLLFWILLRAATWCQLDKTGISAFIQWVEEKQERGLKTLIVGWALESLSLNFCRVHLRCYFKLKSLVKLKRKWFQLHKCWINCSGRDVQRSDGFIIYNPLSNFVF